MNPREQFGLKTVINAAGPATRLGGAIVAPRGEGYAVLQVRLDPPVVGRLAFEVAAALKRGDPPVYVGERLLCDETLTVHPTNLDAVSREAVVTALIRELQTAAAEER